MTDKGSSALDGERPLSGDRLVTAHHPHQSFVQSRWLGWPHSLGQ